MYEAQRPLLDAYLEAGREPSARHRGGPVAREPWEHAHIDRSAARWSLLGVPDPDTLIADRLSGRAVRGTDPFMTPTISFSGPRPPSESLALATVRRPSRWPLKRQSQRRRGRADRGGARAGGGECDRDSNQRGAQAPRPTASRGASAANVARHSLRPRVPGAAAPIPNRHRGTTSFSPMCCRAAGVVKSTAKPPLPSVRGQAAARARGVARGSFKDFRSEVTKQTAPTRQARNSRWQDLPQIGMIEEPSPRSTEASRNPSFRFESASLLGRLYQRRDDLPHAAEWLERASERRRPAPTKGASCSSLGVIPRRWGRRRARWRVHGAPGGRRRVS